MIIEDLRNSAQNVSEQSKDVSIEKAGIERFCTTFMPLAAKHWLAQAPFPLPLLPVDDQLAFIFVLNSVSFSYWGEPPWTISYQGRDYDGTWAMLASLAKAVLDGKMLLHADYLSEMPRQDLCEILAGNVEIPLFSERLSHLRGIGQKLKHRYDGEFKNIVEEARNDAPTLLHLIIHDFPTFLDVSTYETSTIGFFKRAQLLVSDIGKWFANNDSLRLHRLDELTACADYRLPQVMRRYGILSYSPDLTHAIDNRIEIPRGDPWEVEIRANTIHAVERLKQDLDARGYHFTSVDINDYLWLEGQVSLPQDKNDCLLG